MEWIEINGVVLRYELSGAGSVPLLLIHELGGSLESWDPVLPALQKEFRVLRYDLRGFGMSEKMKTIRLDDLLHDIAGLLDALALVEPCNVVGAALGAAIALAFAAEYPTRVRRLALSSPAIGVPPERRAQMLQRAVVVDMGSPDGFYYRFKCGPEGRISRPGTPRGRMSPAPDLCSLAPLQLHPQFLAATKACLPVLPGVLAFGIISGVAMSAAGMPHYMAMAMSLLVYAGTTQLVAMQLITSGTPLAIAILAGLVINLRLSIYSLSITPHLAAAGTRWRPLLSYLLTDNGYALTILGYERPMNPSGKVWYYFGSCATVWMSYQIGTLTGIVLGPRIPAGWQLEFSIVLTFLAIVAPIIRDRAVAAAACAAGITAVLAWSLPLRLGLLLAVAVGIAAGMMTEHFLAERRR